MKNKFNFAFLILVFAGALAFVSCSNGVNGYEDFKFTLTGPQIEAMMNAGSERSVVTVDDYDFSLTVTLFVNGEAAEERNATANIKDVRKPGFEGIKLSFPSVPVGAEVYVQVIMDYEGEQIQAESNKIKVKKGRNSLVVEIKGIKVIQNIDTDIVVFGNKNGIGNELIYQISDVSEAAEINENSTNQLQPQSYSQKFAFDSKGRILYSGYISNGGGGVNFKFFSKDITVEESPLDYVFYYNSDLNTTEYEIAVQGIYIDRSNDSLYILECLNYFNENYYKYILYKYPSFVSEQSRDGEEFWNLDEDWLRKCSLSFAVNKGVLYLSDEDYLYSIDLPKDTTQNLHKSDAKKIPLNLYSRFGVTKEKVETASVKDSTETCKITFSDAEIKINDISYIDGNIYLVVAQYLPNSSYDGNKEDGFNFKRGFVSRGGIIKVELKSNNIKTLGWYDKTTIPMGKKYKGDNEIYLLDTSVSPKQPINEDKGELLFIAKSEEGMFNTKYSSYNVMSNKEINNYFMGPQKIVAIKPKKLIVLDGGFFLYTDKDFFYYGQENRLVEVDLKNFAINDNNSIAKALRNKNAINNNSYLNIINNFVLKYSSGIIPQTVSVGPLLSEALFYYQGENTPIEKEVGQQFGYKSGTYYFEYSASTQLWYRISEYKDE